MCERVAFSVQSAMTYERAGPESVPDPVLYENLSAREIRDTGAQERAGPRRIGNAVWRAARRRTHPPHAVDAPLAPSRRPLENCTTQVAHPYADALLEDGRFDLSLRAAALGSLGLVSSSTLTWFPNQPYMFRNCSFECIRKNNS